VAEPEVGVIYRGKVVKLVDFGAFVNFLGSRDGLVHVSEMAPHRVKQPSDVAKVGEQVYVKVLGIDERGKVRLSMKVVDQQSGKELPPRSPGEGEQREAGGAD
jgi:polyribonucleotide nucleotidyltransferase